MVLVDIEFMKDVARKAGVHALTMLDELRLEFKADDSYVTQVDRQTEVFIRESLAARYPAFAFQGEEYGRVGSQSGPLWAVDPIDGTTNMVFGLPLWCVSIGLVADGVAAAGVIYVPRTDEMFWGVRGEGAFCNGKPLQAPDRVSLHPEDTLGFTSSAIKTLNVPQMVGRIRCIGSIAIEVVYTAAGHLCSHVGCYEGANDLAAALCIAHEAGCVAAYLTGEPLDMAELVEDGRSSAPFVVAPPQMARFLQENLEPRHPQEIAP